ncbi:hypothetical protein Psed_6807 (plasmid) [Pseudonocardia dioxanivorans CB1190]|uniref:Lipoprotein n=1 Tax=Pseudonocardia dioxanivorans (strain ATCC 55486 / DSM 44775 / JCM 13855 / CB1190) TaxID=675635 RepID=F2L6I4_PSEUX|nr:hypothetical protein [Pseudonocardia dioxanivorans]AEA28878.1 hypothetical protein Psed_6807 [Pseudonocardia dioxanivorans CB1190]
MTTSYLRHLTTLAIGATLTLGLVSACATPHTTDGYISEMRAEMDDYESRNVADSQIVMMGQGMCSYPESLEPAFYQNEYTSPAQQERSAAHAEITKRYCDVLPPMTTPINETDAGMYEGDTGHTGDLSGSAQPAAAPIETPVVLNEPNAINYGGTENVVEWTLTSVDRCNEKLRLGVTMKTGSTYTPGTDGAFHDAEYIGTDGVTHDPDLYMTSEPCGEDLPLAYDGKPGNTYVGYVTYDVPVGKASTLKIYGTDGVTRTLDITGK